MTAYDTNPALRAEFPDEIVYHDGFLGWGLVGFLVAAGVIALFILYRMAYVRALKDGERAIDENVKSLRKPVGRAASAKPEDQLELASRAEAAFAKRFAATFALSAELNAATKGLKTAVEGLKPADAAPKIAPLPTGTTVSGGTVIAINVNGGVADTVAPPSPVEPVIEAQPIALWKAVQKLFDELHGRQALAVALKAAQGQLLFSPKWEKPPVDKLKDKGGDA